MRALFIFLPFLLGFSLLSAQGIPVDFISNPDRPLVIENRESGKAVCLFLPENFRQNRNYACKAYECDARTLQVLRNGPELRLPVRGAEDSDLRLLCRTYRGGDYYFALENAGACMLYRIAGSDLSLSKADSFQVEAGTHLIGGVSDGPYAYVLCSRRIKKQRNELLVYTIAPDGRLQEHVVPEPEKQDEVLKDLFKKFFRASAVEPDLEYDPESAAAPVKIFAGPDKIRITFDDAKLGSDNTGTVAAILKVVTVDLTADSMYVARHRYTDRLIFNPAWEGRSSYILGDRLFQLYFNEEQFTLRARDLDSGAPLFARTLLWPDTISNLLNSPLLIPGQGWFGIEKEYKNMRDFLQRFARFRPFLQVRRAGDVYLMSLGGYNEKEVSVPIAGVGIVSGLAVGLAVNISYERTFAFYSAVDAGTLRRSSVYFEKPLFQVYEEMLKAADNPRDSALYRIGGVFYLGYFDKKAKQYEFKKIEGY